jgi:hypothetical protein
MPQRLSVLALFTMFTLAANLLALNPGRAENTEGPPHACRPLGADEKLTLDADEIPLAELTRLVSCALERNLLLTPPTLGGKSITVLAPRPLSRRDLLTVWHTSLERHDLVEERRGAVYLIRPVRR